MLIVNVYKYLKKDLYYKVISPMFKTKLKVIININTNLPAREKNTFMSKKVINNNTTK